jgi:hypothetical protein
MRGLGRGCPDLWGSAKALQEIDEGAATMLSQEAYDAEMQAFMKRL